LQTKRLLKTTFFLQSFFSKKTERYCLVALAENGFNTF